MTVKLRDFQTVGVDDIRLAFKGQSNDRITHRKGLNEAVRNVLFVLPTGGGKCLGRGTPVLMYDGTIKPVEDVVVGDLVMGPDSKPRRVESLARGQEMMYRITPKKGDSYIVNESHILSLRNSKGRIINISVRQILENDSVHFNYYDDRVVTSGHSGFGGWAVPNILDGDLTPQLTHIEIQEGSVDDYYGFELSGPDRLFLLGDFTVTHNTFTFAYITEGAAAKGNRVLIIAHRKELIRQASLSLAALGVFHDVIVPNAKRSAIIRAHNDKFHRPFIRTGANVAVASVQTLARRIEWLQEFNPQLLIPDEAHHAVAGTWKRIIEALPNTRTLGVTATPTRTDGQGLGDVFHAMVEGPSVKWMVENGYLVPARVFRPPLDRAAQEALDSVGRKGQDLDAEAQAAILDNAKITGDVIEHYRELAHERPAIVFCASVKHAEHVTERFCEAGYRFVMIIGDMDGAERDRAIANLAVGKIHGLVSVDVVSEGTDIPVAEVAILLRKTESESLCLQQVGRVLRPVFADGFDMDTVDGRLDAIAASDKHYGLILDHVGNTLTHGLPASDRAWSLDAERRARRKKDDDEPEIKTVQCTQCYHVHEPAPECPECGYKYEMKMWKAPEESGGKLQEVIEQPKTPEQIARINFYKAQARDRHRVRARQEKQKLQAELKSICDEYVTRGGNYTVIGFSAGDIKNMKPKALKAEIDRLGDMLWGMRA